MLLKWVWVNVVLDLRRLCRKIPVAFAVKNDLQRNVHENVHSEGMLSGEWMG
jgi:hypothetical protein